MSLLSFVLNLPWTFLGFISAVVSLPAKISLRKKPIAIIFNVRSFWWLTWRPRKKGARAITIGHIILISPAVLENDLEHELIHVEQFERAPFIQPMLYTYQTLRYGYRQNKYEAEAYDKSGSRYNET